MPTVMAACNLEMLQKSAGFSLPVGRVCDGEYVRRDLEPLLSFVQLDDFLCVDRKTFVGVDDHAKEAGVCLKKIKHGNELLNEKRKKTRTLEMQ